MWYHFEKYVQGHLSAETFKKMDDSITKEEAHEKAKDWATNVNDAGSNHAGWEVKSNPIIKCPPDDWVLKEMATHSYLIKYHQKQLLELNEIENPPVTKYGISYFDDNKKKRVYLRKTYTESIARKKKDELVDKHQKTKDKKHKYYLHKVERIRSIKYLKEKVNKK